MNQTNANHAHLNQAKVNQAHVNQAHVNQGQMDHPHVNHAKMNHAHVNQAQRNFPAPKTRRGLRDFEERAMNRNIDQVLAVALALFIGTGIGASPALADNVTVSGTTDTLTFGGQVNATNINTFFDGGTDAYGTAGTATDNVGITFSAPGEFLNAGYNGSGFNGGTGKFENVPSGAAGVLFMAAVPTTTTPIMNDAAGFSGLSLNYSLLNNTASYASTISLFSGLNGTGSLLYTLTLSAAGNPVACTSAHDEFCTWSSTSGSGFGIAESAVFNGDARTFTEFDALAVNTAVPLPASMWLILAGMGGLAGFARRRAA
jgi:hypothetical protein